MATILTRANQTLGSLEAQIHNGLRHFWPMLFRRQSSLAVSWIRFVVFMTMAYKLLSRDFSAMSLAPDFILETYPSSLYHNMHYRILGNKLIVDLASFHWIHWILPFPGRSMLIFLQTLAFLGCISTAIFGRGPYRIFSVGTTLIIFYLWGFLWRYGSGVDSVFLQFQIMLVYMFTTHREVVLWPNQGSPLQHSRSAGWFYSMCLLVFVFYYFPSGVNKLKDINIAGWFAYDLVDEIMETFERMAVGSACCGMLSLRIIPGLQFRCDCGSGKV